MKEEPWYCPSCKKDFIPQGVNYSCPLCANCTNCGILVGHWDGIRLARIDENGKKTYIPRKKLWTANINGCIINGFRPGDELEKINE